MSEFLFVAFWYVLIAVISFTAGYVICLLERKIEGSGNNET